MPSVLDLSAQQPNPPPPSMVKGKDGIVRPKPKALIRAGKVVERVPAGVTLHQSWCWFGAKDADARHRRALRVHAHWTCFRDGTAVLAYPLPWTVYHGNAWNGLDVGIECEGKYDGAEGTPIETPQGFDVGLVIAAAREAIRETVKRHPTVRYVHAHRQSSKDRGNDPGRLLWREVGLWAARECGLIAEPDRVLGTGKPLPPTWRD